jgi:CRISPR/Cas system endoribonuclease Cas6 (RAMP superfamily)
VRWKSPVVKTRRKHAVTLEAVTPVIIRSMGGRIHRLTPTSDCLQGSLGGSWVQRFGLEFLDREKLIRVEVVKTRTETVVTDLGGKFGKVPGWIGRVDLLINAPGLWLLRTAERLGLGSRTAFGFGRIVVTDTEVMPC